MPELRDLSINQADLSPLLSNLGADLGVFYRALMEQIEATVDQAKSEGWDSERFITAIGALLEPEEASEVEKSLNDTIRTKRIGTVCGLAVWFVNGHYIRDNIYIDFTEGGNHERYDWIPDGEIWIDEEVKPEEVTATIFREFTGQKVMREKGWDYDHAHDFASGLEIAMRQDDELKTRFEKLIRLEPVLKSVVDLKVQKALVLIRSAIPDEVFKEGGKPVGTVSERKDGKYKKTAPGVWEKMTEEREKPKEEIKKPSKSYIAEYKNYNQNMKNKYNIFNRPLEEKDMKKEEWDKLQKLGEEADKEIEQKEKETENKKQVKIKPKNDPDIYGDEKEIKINGKVHDIYYHGAQEGHNPTTGERKGIFGGGLWLTRYKDIAANYANRNPEGKLFRLAVPKYENQFDLNNQKQRTELREFLKDRYPKTYGRITDDNFDSDLHPDSFGQDQTIYDDIEVQDALKELGYEAAKIGGDMLVLIPDEESGIKDISKKE